MNRRSFFKRLAVGAAVAAVTPTVLVDMVTPKVGYSTYVMGKDAIITDAHNEIAGWVSYKFKYTVTLPPNTTTRIRFIQ